MRKKKKQKKKKQKQNQVILPYKMKVLTLVHALEMTFEQENLGQPEERRFDWSVPRLVLCFKHTQGRPHMKWL